MYRQNLALNNLKGMICDKTQPTNQPTNQPILVKLLGGARGVMVIVVGNGHDDTCTNPGRD